MLNAKSGKIGVIGSGLGGLAAAVTLAGRGYEVIVFEKNSWIGGKAAVLHEDGFRFDMGPTILTIPSVLRRVVSETGKTLEDEMELVRLDPQWRSFFSDGTTLDLVAAVDQMTSILDEYTGRTEVSEGYQDFMKFSKRLHNISDRFFFWRSLGSLWDMFDFKSMFQPSMLADVMQMRMGKTVAECIRSHVPDARVAQMLDHFTQYVGSAPDESPAVLCGIAHMQTEEGVWYPMGGTRAVPVVLEKLCKEMSVEIRTNTSIKKISTNGSGAVSGVVTGEGEEISLAAIVCNSDTARSHAELINGKARARFEKRKHEPACSGVVLYLGLRERYEHLLHHNFVFSRDHTEEFDAIYRNGEAAPDPTCYVCAPAATEKDVAPDGGEALYVLVHTPYLRPHHDWKTMLPAYRQVILDKLKSTAGMEDIEDRIVVERHLTPQDIHDRYHVFNGAIYGLASHGRYMGAFKPANRSPDVPGLYFSGGSAHPGPGMPMVLMSGWIAANTLDEDGVVQKSKQSLSTSVAATAS